MVIIKTKKFVLSAHCDEIYEDTECLHIFTPIPAPIYVRYKDECNTIHGIGLQWLFSVAYVQVNLPINNAILK